MKQENIEGKLVSISAEMEGVASNVNYLLSGDNSPVAKVNDDSRPHGLYEARDGDYVIDVRKGLFQDNKGKTTIKSRPVSGTLKESDVEGLGEVLDYLEGQGVGYKVEKQFGGVKAMELNETSDIKKSMQGNRLEVSYERTGT